MENRFDNNQKIPEIKTREIAIGILGVFIGGACIFLLLMKKGYFHQNMALNNTSNNLTKSKTVKIRNSAEQNEQNNMTEFSFTLPKH